MLAGTPTDRSGGNTVSTPTIEEFIREAEQWLESTGLPRRRSEGEAAWGEGEHDVSVFHNLDHEAERALLGRLQDWQRRKFEAGFGALTWPEEYGGRGLPVAYEDAFAEVEGRYETPRAHELFSVTLHLIAPTIRLLGTPQQRERLIRPLLSGRELACQLFSEPEAGSDLAALGTRAVRDGDSWVVTGQKVWSSGAQFAQWGQLLARTDPDVPKHAGITAFMVPMDLPGVEVRPLRQMSGGTSFNEVFLTEVRVPDALRLGQVGQGWQVALTTLGFERQASSANEHVGGTWEQLLALARWAGADRDPLVRQGLARVAIGQRLARVANARDRSDRENGRPLGAVGSVRKLQWVRRMLAVSEVAREVLGPRLVVDSGEWGTYSWSQHVLGVPGYRIAGGSDEIQRTIIAERLLGLPPEPREDRDKPWKEVRR